jgi:signal peptidase I
MVCRRIRRLIERTILLVVGWIILRSWFIEGFPVFCEVQGGSMATALLGDHVDSTCPNCKFTFSCDAMGVDEAQTAICPNCAAVVACPSSPRPLAGDRVLLDRTAFQFRPPKRWEVVAFQRLNVAQDLLVKRVVGLPSERIEIRDGDIYANGQIQRKTLRQQRALRILVNDDEFAGTAPRWQPLDAGSNWTRQHGRRVHAENTGDDIGWLIYGHTSPGQNNAPASTAVTDYVFYNRGRLQQRNEAIHPMADVAMSFRIEDMRGSGRLSLRATDGRDEFMVQIVPGEKKYLVFKNRQALNGPADLPGPLRGQTVEVSLFDRQFLLSIAGRTLVTADIDTPGLPPLSEPPLAIGAQGLVVVVDRLRVYRDVYYTMPPFAASGDGGSSSILGVDEYFVLGDNSPVSEDCRTWAEDHSINHKSLVGKPFVVIYPACEISPLGWRIQVPDLTRIRYIR